MTDPVAPRKTGPAVMSKGRVEAFSDGVMAVAITLLVLDLHAEAGGEKTLAEQLRHEWPAFAAYVTSFLVIGVIWVNHHALLSQVRSLDRGMVYLNLMLLFWISTIPFTTSVLASFLQVPGWDGRLAVLLYGLSMEGMAIAFTMMLALILRHRLTIRPVDPEVGRVALRRFGLGSLTYPLVTAAGLISPVIMLVALASMTLWYAFDQTPILPDAQRQVAGD